MRRKGKKKKKKTEEKKTKEVDEEEGEAPPATAVPPPQRQHTHRQHREQLVDVWLVAPIVTFLLWSPPAVHVACEQWRVIHCSFFFLCWAEPSPCIWTGFGPAYRNWARSDPVKKNLFKFSFQNFVTFSSFAIRLFTYYRSVFYFIKIRIRY
jgi:hypothetical protein